MYVLFKKKIKDNIIKKNVAFVIRGDLKTFSFQQTIMWVFEEIFTNLPFLCGLAKTNAD